MPVALRGDTAPRHGAALCDAVSAEKGSPPATPATTRGPSGDRFMANRPGPRPEPPRSLADRLGGSPAPSALLPGEVERLDVLLLAALESRPIGVDVVIVEECDRRLV